MDFDIDDFDASMIHDVRIRRRVATTRDTRGGAYETYSLESDPYRCMILERPPSITPLGDRDVSRRGALVITDTNIPVTYADQLEYQDPQRGPVRYKPAGIRNIALMGTVFFLDCEEVSDGGDS